MAYKPAPIAPESWRVTNPGYEPAKPKSDGRWFETDGGRVADAARMGLKK